MCYPFLSRAKVPFVALMSTLVLLTTWLATPVRAHEVFPAIADMEVQGSNLVFDIELTLEPILSGIDQSQFTDTNDAPQAAEYDVFRALNAEELAIAFEAFWPEMAQRINVSLDGNRADLTLLTVDVAADVPFDLPRTSKISFAAPLSNDAQTAQVAWDAAFGALVLRQQGVPSPFDAYLANGAETDPIDLRGGDQAGGWETFVNYIPVGFDHIVPKGLDHILFVLGLFFLSTRLGPLVWQISAFTLAHTITLALAALGYVNIPGEIVEPLIALSIVYVAIENLFTDGLSRWRPAIIFGFGLLHGLGFASVLAEFGLPQSSFIPALIGFNIGVEIGQLAVIAVAYICVFKAIENAQKGDADKVLAGFFIVAMLVVIALLVPLAELEMYADLVPLIAAIAILLGLSAASASVPRFEGYREIVAMPGSILIAVVAAYWCVERVFL